MATKIIVGFIIAAFTGLITFMFWSIENKINKMQKEQALHYKEQIEMRVAERDLLLAEASISALSARCIRGEKVNGELEQAENYLLEKKHAIQDMTNRLAVERTGVV